MSSQIFRKPFPKEKLVAFLDGCTENKNNSYVFSKTAFKAAQYKDIVVAFCKEIEGYYYESKKYYATRGMTYKNIVTIIRQICKYHFIPFTSNIKYYKSVYEISYTIFMPTEQ
jgi:hypothetical protein